MPTPVTTGQTLPSSDLAEAIVRTIREPLLILDGDFRVVLANPAYQKAFRTSEVDMVGRSLYTLGNGQWDTPALRLLLEEVLPGGKVVEDFEVEGDFVGLGTRVMVLNARRLEEDGERPRRILLAIEDRTAESMARQSLLRSNQELERFAYVASHDLQEPLRMVASYTTLLAKRYQGQLDEQADRYIRYAVDGAERMRALIRDLLAYSRIGTSTVTVESIDSAEVFREVVGDLQLRIQETDARVISGELPMVQAEPGQFRQLLQNLLENALKFSGDLPPVIEVTAERSGEWIHFMVRDEGPGIAPEYFEKIFIIFQRLHGRETEGTGIGLALCRRIVERHGGKLWVESQPGEGSSFHFTLPAAGG